MKPRTKLQARVYALSVALPKLDEELRSWAFENCMQHIAYRTKKATCCLSCGYNWKGNQTSKKEVCPSCDRTLTIETTRKKLHDQMAYFAVLDVVDGFQIIRLFQVRSYHKAGLAPTVYSREVVQQWMQLEGKHEIVARNRGGMGYYVSDHFNGDLEIRNRKLINGKYNLWPTKIHPSYKVLPIYSRNGFKGQCGPCTPYEIFTSILSDSKAETLLKARQLSLLGARIDRGYRVAQYWDSVKICLRNNYKVNDAGIWLDYLDLLTYFRKDLRSPKYICPFDLKKAHDRLVDKKRDIQNKEELQRKRERAALNEKRYQETKSMFFGLFFTDGKLSIKVLESVQEFIEEGDAHKHCVFTNNYFDKPDSLIFSAKVDGKPVETVEVSLSNMKVVQARGRGNEATEFHEKILDLVNRNLNAIAERRQSREEVAA